MWNNVKIHHLIWLYSYFPSHLFIILYPFLILMYCLGECAEHVFPAGAVRSLVCGAACASPDLCKDWIGGCSRSGSWGRTVPPGTSCRLSLLPAITQTLPSSAHSGGCWQHHCHGLHQSAPVLPVIQLDMSHFRTITYMTRVIDKLLCNY